MTATIVAAPQSSSLPPRVQLTIAGVATATATVVRTDVTGAQYGVRGGEPLTLVAGAGVLFDYEAPYSKTATYTVIDSSGSAVATTTATLGVISSWLIRPAFPSMSIPLTGVTLADETLPTGVVRQPIPGRAAAIPIGDGQRKTAQSTLTHRTVDDTTTAAANAIVSGTDTLLLQVVFADGNNDDGFGLGPFGLGLFGGGGTVTSLWEYISIDDVVISRVSGKFGDPRRKFSLPFTVADRPAGSVVSEWTWASVIADYTTWQDVLDHYVTWTGVLTGAEGT